MLNDVLFDTENATFIKNRQDYLTVIIGQVFQRSFGWHYDMSRVGSKV